MIDAVLDKLTGVVRAGEGWKAVCPAHSDLGPSLSVKSGEGGKILLHCFAGCSFGDIVQAAGLTEQDLLPDTATGAPVSPPRPPVTPAVVLLRDRVYRDLIGLLKIDKWDMQGLRDRGMSDERLHGGGYRTLKFTESRRAARALYEAHGRDLFKVPGFVVKDGQPHIQQHKGLLIPVRDEAGRILACQVRTGEPHRKYVWMSTPDVSSGTPCHIPLGVKAMFSPLIITEGPLKADVVNAISGEPVIGIGGVSSWRAAIPVVQRLGAETAHIAFDMDREQKKPVRDMQDALETALRGAGVKTKRLTWDTTYKGLDDALAAGVSRVDLER